MSRYHFYRSTTDNSTICTTTFAGKLVRAVAKLSPKDSYNEEFGKELAKARVDVKVGILRKRRALKKFNHSIQVLNEAQDYYNKMVNYYNDACYQLIAYEENLKALENTDH